MVMVMPHAHSNNGMLEMSHGCSMFILGLDFISVSNSTTAKRKW